MFLSKILQWYFYDFGTSKREVLQWVMAHLSAGDSNNSNEDTEEAKEQLKELLKGRFKVVYRAYDWNLNSQ